MQRAVKVKPMNNYLILVRFDTGEEKVYNCFPLLENRLFERLREKAFFEKVHIDNMGLVCWDDATDINPYELYDNSEKVSEFTF